MPKFFRESQAKIKKHQQSISRKKKGSANCSKAQLKLARTHAHVTNQRLDFAHKLTTYLIQTYDTIYLEDLNVAGIQRFNGKIIHDNIMAMFRAQLEYKAELYDRHVVCINRFFPSSKKCSACGNVKAELPLSQRTYHCSSCGLVLDRDLNAALNILAAGQAVRFCDLLSGPYGSSNRSLIQKAREVNSGNPRPSGRGGCQSSSLTTRPFL